MAVAPHSPSAVQEALSLPEIFAMILEAEECSGDKNYLVPILDVRDLRNAMRVNRLWFEIAAEKIWADWGIDVLAPVSRLQNLEELTIDYLQSNIIDVEALMKLGALSRLSRLHLGPFPHETRISLVQSEFSDHDCEALARRLPHLRHLRLRMQCNISTKAVEAFLRHCPNLRKCEVFQPLNTDNLFTAAPGVLVFPQLATLNLKRLTGEEIMSRMTPEEFCDSFESQFPGIKEMRLWYGTVAEHNYYEEAFSIWRSRREGRAWDSDGNSDSSQEESDSSESMQND
ncbi:uncharacterized protein TrAFT101_008721 [Trichoderma asperellum]|uniref:F-box domain-containing protein n=1 Tax=Trichoderma asperellum (strain ATCC 204424 / CBS 433.97 / NBRC 101777) TaxID=1042311 RepID=A0A2T3ZBJ9_TRIA4|nr:hypothetical protein M441DRAFT_25955 [Trichoderma asperellum CBS 433.97]PTB42179.1 hypothetical protein M441DRAFT_25955 [Trichoderma asperellum CBS 433.97]UKZ93813.1 hypothetical protein TrAFT101_008721 [Trichoderma asperellum]